MATFQTVTSAQLNIKNASAGSNPVRQSMPHALLASSSVSSRFPNA